MNKLYNCKITELPRLGHCRGCDCCEISIVSVQMAEDAARRKDFAQEERNIEAAVLWLKIETEILRRIAERESHDVIYDNAFGHPGVDTCRNCSSTSMSADWRKPCKRNEPQTNT